MKRLAPVIFVLLWSTGFIGAKYGLPYAEPFVFLTLRMFAATVLLMFLVVLLKSERILRREQVWQSALAGLLLHGGYLGGVFFGIAHGLPAGVSAVIVSLQPVLVSVLAVPLLNERLRLTQIVGLVVGSLGVLMVLLPGLANAFGSDSITTIGLISGLVALLCGTSGTLVQKKFGAGIPMLAGTSVQYVTSGAVFALLALTTESLTVQWTGEFIFALAWLTIALSIGAILLLFFLLRNGSAAGVSSLYYLVPTATSIEAYLLFGEHLSALSIVGVVITAAGVSLVLRPAASVKIAQ